MRTRSVMGGLAASLVLSTATEAATIVTTTYTGEVSAGGDLTGIFGAPLANLTGAAFTAVFVMDIDQPTRITVPGVSDTVIGGGANSPYVSAALTINGITYDFGYIDNGGVQVTAGNQSLNAFFQEENDKLGMDFRLLMSTRFFGAPAVPSLLDAPFSTDVGLTQGSAFSISVFNHDTMKPVSTAWGNMSVHSVSSTVSQTGAIPEPSTWALMILGFGSAGAALRRSKALAGAA